MSNPYIIVTRGLPGSGKSTWANNLVKTLKGFVKVERDDIRQAIFKSYWTGKQEDEAKVTRLQHALVRSFLKEGTSVIVSDTNLPDKSVKVWLKLGHELGVDVVVQDFRDVPLETVLAQNAERSPTYLGGKRVDDEVIIDKYNRFVKGRNLMQEVEYTPPVELEIEPYVQPDAKTIYREAVLFDIDGTLAVMGDRSPYDGAKVWIDTPNEDVRTALSIYWESRVDVIIVSGRDEIYREVTEKWLRDNGIPFHHLYMRPTEEGNKREDSIIKYELFNKHIRPENYRILGVYDDRHRVLRMWRELGLTTFHVNGPDAGDF